MAPLERVARDDDGDQERADDRHGDPHLDGGHPVTESGHRDDRGRRISTPTKAAVTKPGSPRMRRAGFERVDLGFLPARPGQQPAAARP